MIYSRLSCTFLFTLTLLTTSCDRNDQFAECECTGSEDALKVDQFRKRVAGIQRRIIDLTYPGELFSDQEFNEVYHSPLNYYAEACTLLQESTLPELNKMIIVHSMERLPAGCVVGIARLLYSERTEGHVSDDLLADVLIHSLSGQTAIVENIGEESVDSLIADILTDASLSTTLKESLSAFFAHFGYEEG